MVKTKSVYDPVESDDGERILVTRYWPRGLSKERLSLSARMLEVGAWSYCEIGRQVTSPGQNMRAVIPRRWLLRQKK